MRLDDDKGIKDSFNSFTHAPKKKHEAVDLGLYLVLLAKEAFLLYGSR